MHRRNQRRSGSFPYDSIDTPSGKHSGPAAQLPPAREMPSRRLSIKRAGSAATSSRPARLVSRNFLTRFRLPVRRRCRIKGVALMTLQGAKRSAPPATGNPPLHRRIANALGPGLITGASDDDPSGIATYSQAGAQFGFSISWTMLLTYPLMAAIQEISARIGRTTGRGIAGNIRRHFPDLLLQSIVALLLVANTINIGADLGAMCDALAL